MTCTVYIHMMSNAIVRTVYEHAHTYICQYKSVHTYIFKITEYIHFMYEIRNLILRCTQYVLFQLWSVQCMYQNMYTVCTVYVQCMYSVCTELHHFLVGSSVVCTEYVLCTEIFHAEIGLFRLA